MIQRSAYPDISYIYPTPLKCFWTIVCRNVYKTRTMTLLQKLDRNISRFESKRNRGSFQTIESNWIPLSKVRGINFFFFIEIYVSTGSRLADARWWKKHRIDPSSREGKIDYRENEAFFFFFNYLMDLAYREECFS